MCGRFAICISATELAKLFNLTHVEDMAPRYNVAPSQKIPAVRIGRDGRQLNYLLWGLVPHMTKETPRTTLYINVRSETATKKPTFKEAFAFRRCLLPASGFYEWKKFSRGKQPYYFKHPDDRPLALGGLWDRWQNPSGEAVESCAILTTAANETVRPLHHRMPVIIEPEDFTDWLDPATEPKQLAPVLAPYPAANLMSYPVNRLVNRVQNDGPECIQPWTPPEASGLFE